MNLAEFLADLDILLADAKTAFAAASDAAALEAARIEFLGAAKLSPNADPLVVRRLGMIYHAQGRTYEASQVLTPVEAVVSARKRSTSTFKSIAA